MSEALIALDQSSSNVGWVIFLDGEFESCGVLKPDAPDYDILREWVRDMVAQLRHEGYEVRIAVESIYLGYYPVKDKTGRVKMQPQVQSFKVMAQAQAHIWGVARDLKVPIQEVTAYDAMRALTGIKEIRTKREVRKSAMVKYASELIGRVVTDHEADAMGIGVYVLNEQATLVG